jgi:hypothetical protein
MSQAGLFKPLNATVRHEALSTTFLGVERQFLAADGGPDGYPVWQ